MPSNDDGTEDGLSEFRKAFGEADVKPPPHEHKLWKQITLLAIDEFTEVALRCRNGHPVQWVVEKGTPEESKVNLLARYPRAVLLQDYEQRDPNFLPTPVCVTCGEDVPDA